MKLAITYENGNVFGHFGRTEHFALFEISNGKVEKLGILDSNGTGHGALAGLLKANGVDALICGGIGGGAKSALAEENIEIYPGAMGNTDELAKDFAEGKLAFDADAECHHHEHSEGHDCRHNHGHGCGHNCR